MSHDALILDVFEPIDAPALPPETVAAHRPSPLRGLIRGIGSAAEWVFGAAVLFVGLAVLAALPLAQFLSLGYFLESSARVARSGRLRDGVFGVRRAARVGGTVAGLWLATLPSWLVAGVVRSADVIDPGGPLAWAWWFVLVAVVLLTLLHVAAACARGGRLRHFLWPFGHGRWLVRQLAQGGLYGRCRDGLWASVVSLRLPYYFRLGLFGALGTLAYLLIPATLIAAGGRFPLVGILGAIALAVVAPWLPFLQVRYAVEGRLGAMFSPRAIRERFRRAPWAFAFALLVLLLAAVPLYLLKIEMIPREAAWLPSLVFVAFLAPARLLVGWAYARSGRRERPRHWLFRTMGRLAIVPASLLYVGVVFLAQYTSWGGVAALYEQHAFLLPVPFVSM